MAIKQRSIILIPDRNKHHTNHTPKTPKRRRNNFFVFAFRNVRPRNWMVSAKSICRSSKYLPKIYISKPRTTVVYTREVKQREIESEKKPSKRRAIGEITTVRQKKKKKRYQRPSPIQLRLLTVLSLNRTKHSETLSPIRIFRLCILLTACIYTIFRFIVLYIFFMIFGCMPKTKRGSFLAIFNLVLMFTYSRSLPLSLFHSVYIKSSENMFRFVYAMSEFSFRFTLYSPTICTLFLSVCHWKPVHSVCVFYVAGFCLFSHKPSAKRLCCGIVFSVPSVCQLFRK